MEILAGAVFELLPPPSTPNSGGGVGKTSVLWRRKLDREAEGVFLGPRRKRQPGEGEWESFVTPPLSEEGGA